MSPTIAFHAFVTSTMLEQKPVPAKTLQLLCKTSVDGLSPLVTCATPDNQWASAGEVLHGDLRGQQQSC